jgi:hypothetical protein
MTMVETWVANSLRDEAKKCGFETKSRLVPIYYSFGTLVIRDIATSLSEVLRDNYPYNFVTG